MADANTESRLKRWRAVTLATLLIGYAGYYLCRSNLSVSVDLIVSDPAEKIDKEALGAVMSVGIGFYVLA